MQDKNPPAGTGDHMFNSWSGKTTYARGSNYSAYNVEPGAAMTEPVCYNCWCPCALEPMLQQKKPPLWEAWAPQQTVDLAPLWSGLNICIFLISKMLLSTAICWHTKKSKKHLFIIKESFWVYTQINWRIKLAAIYILFFIFLSPKFVLKCEIFCTISTQTHLL